MIDENHQYKFLWKFETFTQFDQQVFKYISEK